jgi:DNA repair protein RecN (Recombination protein N)
VAVEFGPGLNLLTGETGAGKSILIDALSLLLGEKASAEMVRHGAEKAVVTAVFDGEDGEAAKVLEENGLDAADGQLILRREIAAAGDGRVFVNNQRPPWRCSSGWPRQRPSTPRTDHPVV